MKVKINHKLLSDAPLNSDNEPLFKIAHKDTDNFIEDLVKGTPTCYLVSGYRGSGKSSFIKKVESEITKHKLSSDKEPVFVYTNFPKYHDHGLALRKLIRSFYNTISKCASYRDLLHDKSEAAKKTKDSALMLGSLYDKTFFETQKQNSETLKITHALSLDFDWWGMLFALLGMAATFSASYKLVTLFAYPTAEIINWTLAVLLFAGAFFKFSQSYSRNKERLYEFSRKSMYDNEIADHYLLEVLDTFKDKYRVIFVLDELDKIPEEDVTCLLNEMKPFFIAGTASFIIVAGQKLYHQYTHSRTIDDALLSSLFSKFIHVPLFSFAGFENIFDILVIKEGILSQGEKDLSEKYLHNLVLAAKRIPRRFIGLIRQNLTWENGEAFLYINDTPELDLSSKMNKAIGKICETQIAPEGIEDAVKDYCIMQLYLKAGIILSHRNKMFTAEDISK